MMIPVKIYPTICETLYLLNTMFNRVAKKIVAKIANNNVSMPNYRQFSKKFDKNVVENLCIVVVDLQMCLMKTSSTVKV